MRLIFCRSGIKLDDGVVVNEYMQTNKPYMFAAGYVANFFDPVFGRHRRGRGGTGNIGGK